MVELLIVDQVVVGSNPIVHPIRIELDFIMTNHVLLIQKENKDIFDLIKKEIKTIETRAAIDEYKKIVAGDTIVFSCDNHELHKKVRSAKLFKTIDDLLKYYPLSKILPGVKSIEEAKKIWLNFPKYPEKLKKYGLIAWELE